MKSNQSYAVLLTLETLGISDAFVYPAFVFGTLAYLFIMFCNLLVFITIVLSKKLHKPMFILLLNLPISDMMGATAFFPHLIFSIVTKNRMISYPACVIQGFVIHFYGTANFLILSAMAYDRYIAICCPLRYNNVMTPSNLVRIIIITWLINFSIMGTLFFLMVRLRVCKTNIVDLYCNNPSLMKVLCGETSVNSLYGLIFIVFVQGGPLSIIIYTYAQILRTCVMTNQADARQKAIQTCGSHLVIFLVLQINTLITLTAHRIGSSNPLMRKALGVSVIIFPPILDPIIYGLKTKELKDNIVRFLKRNLAS